MSPILRLLEQLEDRTTPSVENPGYDFLIQPDGQLVVAGSVFSGPNPDFAVIRYTSKGAVDTSFGVNGGVSIDFGGYDVAQGIARQSDGKLVIAGFGGNGDFALTRLYANGTLDKSFGTLGKVLTDFGGTNDGIHRSGIVIQDDGKIVTSGFTYAGGGGQNFALTRYKTDGQPDPTFGDDGKVITDFSGENDAGAQVALQKDGKIVVAGIAGGLSPYGFGLARYSKDGSPDETFGDKGKVAVRIGNASQASSLVVRDDKILVGGWSSIGTDSDFTLARFDAKGAPDETFGAKGVVITDLGTGNEEIGSLALLDDGRILAAGFSGGANVSVAKINFTLARYTPSGGLDKTFGTAGSLTTDFAGGSDFAFATEVQPDGNIVVAGQAFNGQNNDFALLRATAGGQLDVTFDGDGKVTTDWPLPPAPTPAPLTIITHGLVLPVPFIDSEPPSWTHSVRESLADRGLDSVVFDWANESNNPSPGWAEAAGDELFARIMWDLQLHTDVAPQNLHFIGHSRGTVVNSEANRRLAHYQRAFEAIGAAVGDVQFTMLDPHPANNQPGLSVNFPLLGLPKGLALLAIERAFEAAASDADPEIWSNVTWADSYFQRTPAVLVQPPTSSDFIFNLWGYGPDAPIPWTDAPFTPRLGLQKELTARFYLDDQSGPSPWVLSHTRMGSWYAQTIRDDHEPVDGVLFTDGGGWHYSMGGAGWSARPRPERPDGLDPTGPVSVFNGSFAYSTEFDSGIPGWDGSGAFEVVGASNEMQLRTTLLSPFRAAVTHNPLFIPPRSEALRFTITNDATNSPTSMLNVYFLPATFDVNGQLVPDESRKVLMQNWRLGSFGDLTIGTTTKTLALPDLPGPLGAVGSFQFELLTPGLLHKSVVTIDDVELVRGGMTRRFGNNNGYEGMPRVSISPSFLVQATESQAYRSVGDRWTATLPYEARIGNLSEYLRTRVTDDFTPDKLLGGEGRDWFFVSLTGLFRDRLLDPIADDWTTDITGW